MNGSNVRRTGFTLIELLVVVAIIAILMSILMPSLRRARDQAKEVQCRAQLRDFGNGFHAYAVENKDYLCSGAFDPDVLKDRDGPVDRVGWVADLVNRQLGFPAKALCPSNGARVNQKLGQGTSGCFGQTFPGGDSYATWDQVDDRIKRGYNTNYTQSWYMARSEVRNTQSAIFDGNVKKRGTTRGPLQVASMLRTNPGNVPLLGDGGLSDEVYAGKLGGLSRQTVKTMGDGPAEPAFGPQDYDDFGPAHGFGKAILSGEKSSERDRANVLFADAHVAVFVDRVRDGKFALRQDNAGAWAQDDLDPTVFDGVLSLGRRSQDSFSLK